ncbi:MAG: Ni/Fe hydrogenase subunit alpha [archaeon]|nr:MAG: Ni/Fe hydrogenase subunit alpha [archaeon]
MEEIKVNHLTKIEGHAKLRVKFDRKRKQVKKCSLEVFESPRYFEALIKGRDFREVPYLAGRICGICNVAHLIGSTLAVEDALGIKVSEQTKLLRELLVLSGIFHSHVLQIYMLALPDYLGYSSALDMKGKDIKFLKRCLELKEAGNDVVNVVGGRSIHPLTSVVGGFTTLPPQNKLNELVKKLRKAKKEALKTAELFKKLKTSDFEFKTRFLALEKSGCYPFTEGHLASLSGLIFEPRDYAKYLKEGVVSISSAKHVTVKGGSFMVGPLARLNVNGNMLSQDALLASEGMELPSYNVFSGNLARAVETVHCIDRSVEILETLELREERLLKAGPKEGEGISATEAPRGTLFHHYKINKTGKVTAVNIIPPTTQNVKNMEEAVRHFLPGIMGLNKKKMELELEKLIRAYDPCMSCSAHFLDLEFL